VLQQIWSMCPTPSSRGTLADLSLWGWNDKTRIQRGPGTNCLIQFIPGVHQTGAWFLRSKKRAPNLPSKCWRDSLATCPGSDPSQDFQPRCCRCACEGQTVKRCVQHLTPFWSPFVAWWLHCPRDISIGAGFESSVKGGKAWTPSTNPPDNQSDHQHGQSIKQPINEWKNERMK